jgi:hypothetical protein
MSSPRYTGHSTYFFFRHKGPVRASLVAMVTQRDIKEDEWADGGKTEKQV